MRRDGAAVLVGAAFLAVLLCVPEGLPRADTSARMDAMTIALRPDGPPDTIQTAVIRARAARATGELRPIVISLAPGLYRPSSPIRIEGDFGSGGLIIRGEPGGPVELRGSVPMQALPPGTSSGSDLTGSVDDPGGRPALASFRVPEGGDNPSLIPGIYQGDTRLTLARMPATFYLTARRMRDPPPGMIRLALPDMKPDVLSANGRLWVEGYFRNSYTHEWLPVVAVNGNTVDLAVDGPPFEGVANPPIAIDNAAMDGSPAPGSFVLPGDGRMLALRPLAGGGPVEHAALDQIFVIAGASNVTLQGLSVGMVRTMAIDIARSRDVTIEDCAVGWSDVGAIRAVDGREVVVRRTVVHHTGGRGVEFVGGDRRTLSASGHKLIDSIVMDFGQTFKSYRAGVTLSGVGSEVSGSLITNGPHAGLIFFGNDHRIHDNEFSQVVQDRGDAGAIYVGRDWTQRGTEIRHNYFHDIGWGQKDLTHQLPMTVYLDDYTSGTLVADNLFVRTTYPVMIGGGQDNVIEGNRFVASVPAAIRFDARGETWASASILSVKAAPLNLLHAVPIDSDVYRRAYPRLATLLEDNPRRPKHNVIADNSYYGGVPFWLLDGVARTNTIEPPLVKPVDLVRVHACAGRSGATIAMLAETGILARDDRSWSRLPALSTLRYFPIVASELATQQTDCG